jgi:hypothetical protein
MERLAVAGSASHRAARLGGLAARLEALGHAQALALGRALLARVGADPAELCGEWLPLAMSGMQAEHRAAQSLHSEAQLAMSALPCLARSFAQAEHSATQVARMLMISAVRCRPGACGVFVPSGRATACGVSSA